MKKNPTLPSGEERRFLEGGKVELRLAADGTPTHFTGQAIVCGVRSKNLGGFVEIIAKEALDEADTSDCIGVFNHNRDTLLGRVSSGTLQLTRNADGGLDYEIAYDALDPDHVRVMRKIMRGDVVGSSFAFRVAAGGDDWVLEESEAGNLWVRTVKKISRVADVCPVTDPAYADSSAAKRSLEAFQENIIPLVTPCVPLSVRQRQLTLLTF
ncbi:HK97 family phage prohead protease [Hymenobacter sp. HD11105]